MRIFDCFTFYNELDLLQLRISELYDKVDYFVIVEANTTFTSKPKYFMYEKARARFAKWADKIIHVKVLDMPFSKNPWDNEKFQRDAIVRGIGSAEPDDIIIVSDLDEIPRPEAIDYIRQSQQSLFAMRMPLFNFKYNYMRLTPGHYDVWGMAARKSILDQTTPDLLRGLRFNFFDLPYQYSIDGCEVIEHAGWHFGYLGDNAYLRDKAQSFSHQEVNYPEFLANIDVDKSIAERKEWDRNQSARYGIVELDAYFPKMLLADRDRYSKEFILPEPELKIIDLLPPFPYNK